MVLDEHHVRSLVVECLRKIPPNHPPQPPFEVSFLLSEIAQLAKARSLKYTETINAWHDNRYHNPTLHPNLVPAVWNIVWDLIIEGVLRPGSGRDDLNLELPKIHVTTFGKEAIQATATPYDPDGYVKALTDKVPEADDVIIKYIAESAETLRRNCLLSSTVTLGCASEQAFLLLLEAYRDALNASDQATFDKKMEKLRTVKLRHIEFMKSYESQLKPKLKINFSTDAITELETALMFVFTYFRTIRNDAGHPSDAKFNRQLSSANLVMFPSYLRVIYDVIGWLSKNKPI